MRMNQKQAQLILRKKIRDFILDPEVKQAMEVIRRMDRFNPSQRRLLNYAEFFVELVEEAGGLK